MVLLRSPGGTQRDTEDRTRDELRLMGIRVDEVRDPRNDDEVGQIIAEHGALGAVRLAAADGTCEPVTWFTDDAQRGEVTPQPLSGLRGEPGLVALRMAETVRHRVRELQTAADPAVTAVAAVAAPIDDSRVMEAELIPHPPMVVDRAASPSPAKVAASPPEWRELPDELEPSIAPAASRGRMEAPPGVGRERWLGVSAAVAGGPGGARSLLGAAMTFGWRVVSILTVQAELAALASPVSVPVSRGSVQVGLASAQLLCALGLPGDRRVMPRLRVGGGPALTWATGRGTRPENDGDDRGMVAVVTAGAGLAVRVHPRLHLSVGVDLHVFLPAVGARADEVTEFRLGPPLIRGTMGLAWVLPGRRIPVRKI